MLIEEQREGREVGERREQGGRINCDRGSVIGEEGREKGRTPKV